MGTCGSGGRVRRRRAAESGNASSWSCRGSREGPQVQPGRRGDASAGRAIERIAAGSGATVCVGAAPAANETKSTLRASTGSGALSAVRAAKRKTERDERDGLAWVRDGRDRSEARAFFHEDPTNAVVVKAANDDVADDGGAQRCHRILGRHVSRRPGVRHRDRASRDVGACCR
jgi:hypothetical protein